MKKTNALIATALLTATGSLVAVAYMRHEEDAPRQQMPAGVELDSEAALRSVVRRAIAQVEDTASTAPDLVSSKFITALLEVEVEPALPLMSTNQLKSVLDQCEMLEHDLHLILREVKNEHVYAPHLVRIERRITAIVRRAGLLHD